MDKEFVRHLLAGVAGARDDQIEGFADAIFLRPNFGVAELGALQGADVAAVHVVRAEGEQNVGAARSLQGDIHPHVRTSFRVAQVADDGFVAEGPRPGAGVVHLHLAIADSFQPRAILVVVRSVDHHQVFVVGAAIDDGVVDDLRVGGQEVGVERVAGAQFAGVVADDAVEEGGCVRAFDVIHAHVRNVEESRRLTCGEMLLQN